MGLAFFFPQACTTANNLLKFGHGANHFIQHNQFGHFAIGPGRKQLGRGCNHRIGRRNRDEVFQFLFPVFITAGNTHHIVGIFLHHIGVELCQRIPHTQSRVLCCTKHDGLGHAVRALQVVGDFLGYLLDSILDDDIVIVIAVGINPVRDFFSVDVFLPFARAPAFPNVGHDIDDFKWSKETVLNPFFQAVCIDRFAKVAEVGDILGFLGGSRHTDLRGGLKILQNSAPATFLFRRTSVTLINNDEIKEIRCKQFAEMFLIVLAYQLLIQREIYLMGSDGAFVILCYINFMDDLFQRCKILLDGLIDQNVSVSQIENLALHATLQQSVHDLEGSIGLTGACGHNKKNPLLSARNGIHRPVNGDTLVIARRIGILAGIIGLFQDGFLAGCQARFLLVAGSQLLFRWKFFQADLALLAGQEIVLHKTVAIGAIGKGNIQHLGIGHCLLQTMGNSMGIVFCFHNRNRIVCTEVQDIICPLGFFAEYKVALQVNLTVCDAGLHSDLFPAPFR